MKYLAAAIAACAVIAGIYPMVVTDTDPMTKEEQFAVELENCQQAWADDTPGKCELYGEIEIVDNFGDVQVEVVDNFADIQVEWVDNFADSPGEWERVDNFPDYQVEIVDNFGDYKVEFVDNFPGCD